MDKGGRLRHRQKRWQSLRTPPSALIRFLIPVIASLGVTPFALCVGIGFAGGGHGTNFPMTILFPFWMLIFSDGLAHSNFVLFPPLIVQFPIYGIILGFANAKRKLILASCLLLSIHLSAIGWIFGSHYYRFYQSKHDPNNQLLEAVRNDDVPTAKRLLDEGVDPNFHRAYGGPPSLLGLACMDGHLEMAKLLLEKGADINYADPDGGTAFFRAVAFGHEGIVQLLLEKGADINRVDPRGQTALFSAVGLGREEMVQFLLSKGADVTVKDSNRDTV